MIPGRDVDLTSVVLAVSGSAVVAAIVVRRGDQRGCAPLDRAGDPDLGVATPLAAWNPPRFAGPARHSCARR